MEAKALGDRRLCANRTTTPTARREGKSAPLPGSWGAQGLSSPGDGKADKSAWHLFLLENPIWSALP